MPARSILARSRHHRGQVAVRLAAIKPAEAEQLVPQVVPNSWDGARDDYVLRICAADGAGRLARARKILERLNEASGPHGGPRPELVAEGLGLMASDRFEADPAGARELLDEAFDRLRKLPRDERRISSEPPVSNRMAALLPLVERIDPDRLEERLWLAAACRTPLPDYMFLQAWQAPVVLAALVARYDRAMAAAIIAPALDRLPGLIADGFRFSYDQSTVIKALAAYDPRVVTVLVNELPASARKAPEPRNNWQRASIDAQVRLAAAEALGLSVDERYEKVLGGHLGRRSIRRVR